MRKSLLIAVISILAVAGCKKEDKADFYDGNKMISIAAAQGSRAVNQEMPTAKQIVEEATLLFTYENSRERRGFSDNQRDVPNLKLKMWGTDILWRKAPHTPDIPLELQLDFLEASDVIFANTHEGSISIKDTLAYIPNSVLRAAEKQIKEAFQRADYARIYELFDHAYTFVPITGKAYKELKDKGQN